MSPLWVHLMTSSRSLLGILTRSDSLRRMKEPECRSPSCWQFHPSSLLILCCWLIRDSCGTSLCCVVSSHTFVPVVLSFRCIRYVIVLVILLHYIQQPVQIHRYHLHALLFIMLVSAVLLCRHVAKCSTYCSAHWQIANSIRKIRMNVFTSSTSSLVNLQGRLLEEGHFLYN